MKKMQAPVFGAWIKKYLPILIITLIVLVSHLYIALAPADSMLQWFSVDDAYYYFKTAQNITEGKGVTFDGVNPANGFHPLWMIVCLPVFSLARIDRILALRVLVGVLGVLNAATGIILFYLLRRFLSYLPALLAAVFWVIYPGVLSITSGMGMESGINAFFIILLLFLTSRFVYSSKKRKSDLFWLGVVSALTLLSRLDNIFIVAIIGIWLLFRDTRSSKVVVFDAVMAAIIVFGSHIIRIGFADQYRQIQPSMYLLLLLAIVIKPFMLWIFKVDKEINTRIWGIRWIRVVCALLTSFLLIFGFMELAAASKYIWIYSRLSLIYDLLLSFIFMGLPRIIFWKRWKKIISAQAEFLWLEWIKQNWKRVLKEALIFGAPILVLCGIYLIWNLVNFGVLTPISGQVKHWWSTLASTIYSHTIDHSTILGFSWNRNYGPWSLVTSELALGARSIVSSLKLTENYLVPIFSTLIFLFLGTTIGISFIDKKGVRENFIRTGLVFLFLGSLLHISYYHATNYPNTRSWYWVAEMVCVAIFLAILVDAIFRWKSENKIKQIINYSITGLFFAWLLYYSFSFLLDYIPPRVQAGEEISFTVDAREVEEYTEPGSLIGMTGGGTVAYFIDDRVIVNMDGLMNSADYFNALKNGRANIFLDRMGLDYVFGNDYMLFHSSPYRYFLTDRLVKIGRLKGEEHFTLYEYYPGGIP